MSSTIAGQPDKQLNLFSIKRVSAKDKKTYHYVFPANIELGQFGAVLTNWTARHTDPSLQSLVDYINSKPGFKAEIPKVA